MTTVRRAAVNTWWNILGQVIPGLVALVAVPVLLKGLGSERFGVIGLAWATVGYFSMFDFGLSRAVTKFAAECLETKDDARLVQLVWTSWITLALIGLAMTVVGVAVSHLLVARLLKITPSIESEALLAFRVIAIAIPGVTIAAGARGVLEAASAFRLVTIVRIPLGILAFLAPITLLPFTTNVGYHVGAIALTRLLGAGAFVFAARHELPVLRARPHWSRDEFRKLIGYGSWVTVSNIVSPLMSTLDRFVVGAMISVTAVAYYVTSFELASRLLILPAAISTVAFPRFAASSAEDPNGQADRLYRMAMTSIALLLLPFVIPGIVFSHEILKLWVGVSAADGGSLALRWLLVGVMFNALAHIPFARLQGIGAADITAKAHLVELPIYALVLVGLTPVFGVAGVAMAWTTRVALDYVILEVVGHSRGAPSTRGASAASIAAVFAALGVATVGSVTLRAGVVVLAAGIAFAIWSSRGGLSELSAVVARVRNSRAAAT